jgi:quercetin dioxygenase-like cupin family protein
MSAIHKFTGKSGGYTWEGVEVQEYRNEFEGVTKQVVIGQNDNAPHFVIRYFHLEPGTRSNLEQHPHDHGVVVMHGCARLQINADFFEVGPLDAVYISGGDLHQFTTLGDEPLGFICVIKTLEEKK